MNDIPKSWLENTGSLARRFIESYYPGEKALFELFWEVFSSSIAQAPVYGPAGEADVDVCQRILRGVSLASPGALDLMTPIVLSTVADTLYVLRHGTPSADVAQIVAASAARLRAPAGLTACLVRHLPAMVEELIAGEMTADDAAVESHGSLLYEIWTAGTQRVTESIAAYEAKRTEYLFWIDLNETSQKSPHAPAARIGPQAVRLLLTLITHLGVVRPATEIYEEAWDSVGEDVGNIEKQLTLLQKFSGGAFRDHLLRGQGDVKGYGLQSSFKDKYFIFKRLR